MKDKYPSSEIGYSGHECRLSTTSATVMYGVKWLERHITLDSNLWGSDQKSSIEPQDLISLISDINAIDKAIKFEPQERIQFENENIKKESLCKK